MHCAAKYTTKSTQPVVNCFMAAANAAYESNSHFLSSQASMT